MMWRVRRPWIPLPCLALACSFNWQSSGSSSAFAGGRQERRTHRPITPVRAAPTEAAREELRDETRLLRETVTDLVSEVAKLHRRSLRVDARLSFASCSGESEGVKERTRAQKTSECERAEQLVSQVRLLRQELTGEIPAETAPVAPTRSETPEAKIPVAPVPASQAVAGRDGLQSGPKDQGLRVGSASPPIVWLSQACLSCLYSIFDEES